MAFIELLQASPALLTVAAALLGLVVGSFGSGITCNCAC
jgi:hypothetical protein